MHPSLLTPGQSYFSSTPTQHWLILKQSQLSSINISVCLSEKELCFQNITCSLTLSQIQCPKFPSISPVVSQRDLHLQAVAGRKC